MTYQIGQRVEKFTGDYQLEGEIRAIFTTKAGHERYVVEHEPGFLHIYGPSNIRPVNEPRYAGYTIAEMKKWIMMPSSSAAVVQALIAALEGKKEEKAKWPHPDGFAGGLMGEKE